MSCALVSLWRMNYPGKINCVTLKNLINLYHAMLSGALGASVRVLIIPQRSEQDRALFAERRMISERSEETITGWIKMKGVEK